MALWDPPPDLVETAVKTAAYTAVSGERVPVDTTSAAVTVTLPAATVGRTVAVTFAAGANTLSVTPAGTDVFGYEPSTLATTDMRLGETRTWQSGAAGGRWFLMTTAAPPAISVANEWINAKQSYGVKADGSSNDTAAIQAAIDAANAAGGGTVLLPPGVMVASGLVPKNWVNLVGHGRTVSKLRTVTAGADLFVGAVGTYYCGFEGLYLQSVGGGSCYSGELNMSVFRDCNFYTNVDAKPIIDVARWIDVLVQNCIFDVNLTATVPTVRMISSTAAIAAFTFDSCRFTNSGNYSIWLEGTLGAFCHNPTIRNCTFEVTNGGAVKLLSCKNARIDLCGVHDLSATTTRDMWVLDKSTSSGGVPCESTIITGITRDSAATALGAGLYDLNVIDAKTTVIIGANRFSSGFAINLNSKPAVIIGSDPATLTNADAATIIREGGFRDRGPVTLTDAATVATDASLANAFRVTLAGNRTLGAPTNPRNGQRVIWEVTQDATGSRTLTLASGAGGFAFGTDITGITLTTTASKTDFIGAVYNSTADRWRVIAFSKGY